jgi:hypothetical protein
VGPSGDLNPGWIQSADSYNLVNSFQRIEEESFSYSSLKERDLYIYIFHRLDMVSFYDAFLTWVASSSSSSSLLLLGWMMKYSGEEIQGKEIL